MKIVSTLPIHGYKWLTVESYYNQEDDCKQIIENHPSFGLLDSYKRINGTFVYSIREKRPNLASEEEYQDLIYDISNHESRRNVRNFEITQSEGIVKVRQGRKTLIIQKTNSKFRLDYESVKININNGVTYPIPFNTRIESPNDDESVNKAIDFINELYDETFPKYEELKV